MGGLLNTPSPLLRNSSSASRCGGISSPEAGSAQPLADPGQYVDIWTPLCEGLFLPPGLVGGDEGRGPGEGTA